MELDEHNGDDIGASERSRRPLPRGKMLAMKEEQDCVLKKGFGNRWYVTHPNDECLAWSGSRWVPVDDHCLPTGSIQVSNFDSAASAALYVGQMHSFIVVGVKDGNF